MTRKTLPRDLEITDFRFMMHPESVLTDRRGRSYLVFARTARTPSRAVPHCDKAGSGTARRLAGWALYAVSGASAAAMIAFGFVVPSAPVPAATARIIASSEPPPASQPGPAALRAISLNVMRELRSIAPSAAR